MVADPPLVRPTDWVGEVPLANGDYTYDVSVEPSAGIALVVRITSVAQDR